MTGARDMCLCLCVARPVSDSDIQVLERRIMQTMDMIVMKKKRCVYDVMLRDLTTVFMLCPVFTCRLKKNNKKKKQNNENMLHLM